MVGATHAVARNKGAGASPAQTNFWAIRESPLQIKLPWARQCRAPTYFETFSLLHLTHKEKSIKI